MKPLTAKTVLILTLIGSTGANAQFSSGSDGSYGPLIIGVTTTLNMPSNGIFNCTTITVAAGATLRFNRNALNTPVYLLATGTVTLRGDIDVSGSDPAAPGLAGRGGPGGFDGGAAPNGPGAIGGDGFGPGGGRFPAGKGQFNYGNTLLMPLIGGSGGGGARCSPNNDYGGGGGGGAILIASDTVIDFGNNGGRIFAQGGTTCHGGGGSGGAIRVIAPIVAGNAFTGGGFYNLYVYGGAGGSQGSGGWVRVDVTNRFQYALAALGGNYTLGKFMQVFPTNASRLDIIAAAGTNIVEGFPGPVLVQLPVGAPTNQTVTLQARNFTGSVPITVAVTPDAGPSTRYDTAIEMGGGNVAQTNVSVVITAGTTSKIHAWTR